MKNWTLAGCIACLSFGQVALADAPILVDANQQFVGYYSGTELTYIRTISRTGYVFGVEMQSGALITTRVGPQYSSNTIPTLMFLTVDCTGPAFVSPENEFDLPGYVWGHGPADFYYALKGAVPTMRSPASAKQSPTDPCQVLTPAPRLTFPAFPNDPDVTGVQSTPYAPPLSISLFDAWNSLFADGFEAA